MVGATASTHDREEGLDISYLCIQNRAINRNRTYNHTAWASNSGEEKDILDHSATGHFISLKEQQTTVQATIKESHENL